MGNPYPFPGAPGWPAGSSRPGENRWTSGTVALDVNTGELRWGFQAFPHDIFDRDHVLVSLAKAEDHGLDHDVLMSAGKGGVAFGHDPATSEVLWRTSVGLHRNDNLEAFNSPVEVLPGAQGGMVTPVAVANGVFYAAVVNAPSYYESDQVSSGGEGTQLFTRPSNVVAIDIATGDIVWDVEIISKYPEVPSADVLGGMTVVNDSAVHLRLLWRVAGPQPPHRRGCVAPSSSGCHQRLARSGRRHNHLPHRLGGRTRGPPPAGPAVEAIATKNRLASSTRESVCGRRPRPSQCGRERTDWRRLGLGSSPTKCGSAVARGGL